MFVLLLLNLAFISNHVNTDHIKFLKKTQISNLKNYDPLRLMTFKTITKSLHYRKKIDFEFMAFNRHFHIIAQTVPNTTISRNGVVHIHHNSSVRVMEMSKLGYDIYSGWVVGYPNSSVVGFFNGKVFQSIISTEEETYAVEPFPFYVKNTTDFDAIIYRSVDVIPVCINNSCAKCGNSETLSTHPEMMKYASQMKRRESNQRRVCSVEVIGDYLLYAYDNSNEQIVIREMMQMVTFADIFLSRIDFNRDGIADNIGLKLQKITLFKDRTAAIYPFKDFKATVDLQNLLKMTETYNNNYCLVHFLLFRASQNWKSVLASFGGEEGSGICMNTQNTGRSRNVVITSRKFGYYARSLMEVSFSFLHGVAHVFGAPHDDLDDNQTNPKNPMKKYLMNPEIDSFASSVTVLSNYSIDSISGVIHKRGNWCLEHDPGSVCGNIITEEGEECDCGTTTTCERIDPNCTPADETGIDKPCTIRRSKNKSCSARESICCREDGIYVTKEEEKLCTSNFNECIKPEFCNGHSEECRQFDLPYHRSFCAGNSRLCYHGFCNGSICWRYHLQECECSEEKFACYICCLYNDTCDVLYFHLKSLFVQIHKKKMGEYCLKNSGYCDPDGNCIRFKYKLFVPPILYFSAIYFIILGILITCYALMKITYCMEEIAIQRQIRNFRSSILKDAKDPLNRLTILFPTVSKRITENMMDKLQDENLVALSIIASGIPMRIEFVKPIIFPNVRNYNLINKSINSCTFGKTSYPTKHINKALSLHLIESKSC